MKITDDLSDPEKIYMVYNPNRDKPTRLHNSSGASEEAERLSAMYPNEKFFILKIESIVYSKVELFRESIENYLKGGSSK